MVINILIWTLGAYLAICAFFFLIQENLIFIPTKYDLNQEFRFATSFDEVFLDASDGAEINGLLLHAEQPKGYILYLHGNTGSMKRWGYMAEELTSYGYSVFIIDYRGYGKSRGKRSEAKMHEDAELALDWLREKAGALPLVVYGRSLGSGFAVPLAAKKVVDKLVLETPFFSMLQVGLNRFPFIPLRFLLRFPFRSDLHIQKVKCPMLMLHGTKDLVVPYKSALRLYELVEDRKDTHLITLVGGRHNNLNTFPIFHESLKEFLS